MKLLDLNSTISDWISERPHTYHVFSALRIDCPEARAKPLQQECWERQLATLEVLARLHGDEEHDRQEGEHDRSIGLMETVDGG